MTETLFSLISTYGPTAILASAFLSCLALPIPTSLMMLAGGAFAAAGDLEIVNVMLFAYVGAVVGDQAGFAIGRHGGTRLLARLTRSTARRAVFDRAQRLIERHGGIGVFLSTWAVAPLGPWVNFAAGATGLSWLRFAISDALGEIVWVTLYVGLGFYFASNIDFLATMMGNVSGLLAAVVVAVGAALWINGALRAKHKPLQHEDA